MSVSANLHATVIALGGPREVLEVLLGAGWTRGGDAGWRCVPLGDHDEWNWGLLEGEGSDVLLGLLDAKMKVGEVFGAELYWAGTDVGVTVLLGPPKRSKPAASVSLVLGADIHRVKKGPRATDLEWYTSRLLPALERAPGLRIERWEWMESD